jgi:hypothetical protein
MLGAISALGSGAMSGVNTGMDLYQKMQDMQSNQIAMQLLRGVDGVSPGGSYGAFPGGQQQPQQPPTAGPMSTPSAGALARGLPSSAGSPMMGPGGTMMPGGPMSGGMVQPQAPGLGLPQGAMGGAPMGGGAPGPQMTGSLPMMPQQMQPTAQAPRMSVQPAPLAAARERSRVELETTPGLASQLDKLTTAEVGKDPRARQMFQEGLLNRAAARNTPVKDAIGDRSYYPPETYARAQREGGTGMGVTPAMFDPINPANLTNFGTGNASIDPRTGLPVGFGPGGRQTAYYQGEQHGTEGPDRAWARRMGQTDPGSTVLGAAGAHGPGGPTGDVGRLTAQDLMQSRQTGYGPLDFSQMARRIEQSSPGASATAKLMAMKKVSQLMNQNSQQQFNQMMQMLQYQQREEHFQKGEQHKEETASRGERAREQADERNALSQFRADPKIRDISTNYPKFAGQDRASRAFERTMVGHFDTLAKLAEKVNVTGLLPLDQMIQKYKKMFGNEGALEYEFQLKTALTEAAKSMSGAAMSNAGVPVTTQKEMQDMLSGVVPQRAITAIKNLIINDAHIKQKSNKQELDRMNREYERVAKFYGVKSAPALADEEEEAAPPAAAAAPAANDPLGIR